MENPRLGREVLDHIEAHPEQFSMRTWGKPAECGTVGCLAGHTMLMEGYLLGENDRYFAPSGELVRDEAHEAAKLLGLTMDELYNGPPWRSEASIFSCTLTNERALERFRAIVEASEAAKAAAARGSRESAATAAGQDGSR